MNNDEFDNLLNDIISDPDKYYDTNYLSETQFLELQKRINPYLNLIDNIDPTVKQIAVCSYTNLREDYLRRFTLTSFVGFIFQVLHEYEVPKEKRVWVPEQNTNPKEEPFNITSLKSLLLGFVDILTEAELAEIEEKQLRAELLNNELLNEEHDNTELVKKIYVVEEKKTGLLFSITTLLKDLGLSADLKLNVTKQLASKFPETKHIIQTKKHNSSEFPEREFPESKAKDIIYNFLKTWLAFDPSIHVRQGFDKQKVKEELVSINDQFVVTDSEDPNRIPYETLVSKRLKAKAKDKAHLEVLTKNKYISNVSTAVLRDEDLQDSIVYMINHKETFKYYLLPLENQSLLPHIPPQDTFHRWNYFTEVNYEELRTITETLYPERPDLDWAIAIWNTFKGTEAEVDEQFKSYCQKHHDELPSSIKAIEIGKWCFLADFKENRKNIQFYNKNTEVIKRIIDRHTEDKKIGMELMRNRLRQEKAKNIKEYGPDAPGLKLYKNTMASEGKDLVSKGVERVISPEEMKRLEKARGNIQAAKELEVLEENEKMVKQYEEIMSFRQLTSDEKDKYDTCQQYITKAKEMLSVPDDAIQVDVFTTDTKTGEFVKTHFYTKSEEALEREMKLKQNI